MLKFIIIPIARNSVSFCHYYSHDADDEIIKPEILKQAIVWAMKENVGVQFVFPSTPIPSEIIELCDSVDHISIVPSNVTNAILLNKASVVVFDNWKDVINFDCKPEQIYVVHTTLAGLIENEENLVCLLKNANRVNISITDVENFSDSQSELYHSFLENLIPVIVEEYKKGHFVQLNLLTDRLMYESMNNCNAGYESLAISIEGNFYACPAFAIDDMNCMGSLDDGLEIKNSQLYKLSHAPICRICDSWQCRRCVWLSKKMTREVNTPGHQQCAMAHIERDVSRMLLDALHQLNPIFFAENNIPEIDYIDPFDKICYKNEKNSRKGN